LPVSTVADGAADEDELALVVVSEEDVFVDDVEGVNDFDVLVELGNDVVSSFFVVDVVSGCFDEVIESGFFDVVVVAGGSGFGVVAGSA
jgi:hypothetical protein